MILDIRMIIYLDMLIFKINRFGSPSPPINTISFQIIKTGFTSRESVTPRLSRSFMMLVFSLYHEAYVCHVAGFLNIIIDQNFSIESISADSVLYTESERSISFEDKRKHYFLVFYILLP